MNGKVSKLVLNLNHLIEAVRPIIGCAVERTETRGPRFEADPSRTCRMIWLAGHYWIVQPVCVTVVEVQEETLLFPKPGLM